MKKILLVFLLAFVLSACSNPNYNVDVELTPERVTELEQQITEAQEAIDNFVGEEGTIAHLDIIRLANAHVELGQLGEAIKIYEDVLAEDHKTKAILNNLGRIYEDVGEVDKAVALYQRIADEYLDENYVLDIAWAYLRAGDAENAREHYDEWRRATGDSRSQFETALVKLENQE